MPPKCDATSFVFWNSVFPAQAQPHAVHAVARSTPAPFATDLVECCQLLLHRLSDAVFASNSLMVPFRLPGGLAPFSPKMSVTMVFLARALALQLIDQLAPPVRRRARRSQHRSPSIATGTGAAPLRDVVPCRRGLVARRQLRIWPGSSRVASAVRRRARGKRPDPCRTCPCTCSTMPCPPGAGRARRLAPSTEKGLSGRTRGALAQPGDALVRQVLAQVVPLVVRRLDDVGVLHQARLPLRGLAGEEAVEVVEAVAGGPAVEWAHRRGLVGRRVVPLADGCRLVAVVPAGLRASWPRSSDNPRVAVPVDCAFRDRAVAHTLMVASREQSRARGRADRRGVKVL